MLAKTVKIKDGDDFRIINEMDFQYGQHELCDGEELSSSKNIVGTLQVDVETSPELQKVLADTKAECEKVVAENEALQDQLKKAIADLETERAVHIAFMDDVDAMQARIDELKSAAANPDPNTKQFLEIPKEMIEQVIPEASQAQVTQSADNDFASWTIPQIKDYLAAKEIGFKSSASKDELLALIPKE